MRKYKDGEEIRFKSPVKIDEILTGKVRGFSHIDMTIIGRGIIVELSEPISDEYDFSHIIVEECWVVE